MDISTNQKSLFSNININNSDILSNVIFNDKNKVVNILKYIHIINLSNKEKISYPIDYNIPQLKNNKENLEYYNILMEKLDNYKVNKNTKIHHKLFNQTMYNQNKFPMINIINKNIKYNKSTNYNTKNIKYSDKINKDNTFNFYKHSNNVNNRKIQIHDNINKETKDLNSIDLLCSNYILKNVLKDKVTVNTDRHKRLYSRLVDIFKSDEILSSNNLYFNRIKNISNNKTFSSIKQNETYTKKHFEKEHNKPIYKNLTYSLLKKDKFQYSSTNINCKIDSLRKIKNVDSM